MAKAKAARGSKARAAASGNDDGDQRDRSDEDGRSANPLFIASIGKAFEVLERLADIGRPVGLTELCQHASLSRSALQRITHTLTALGYLRQDPKTRAFTLSGKVLHLSHAMLSSDSLRDRALPHLEDLNRRTAETVNLMEMEADEIVYVVRFPGFRSVSVDLHVGSRLPIHCSAAGRAILAEMDLDDAMRLLARVPRRAMTPHTLTELPDLRSALQTARKRGYALNDQESFIGDISIAKAILNRQREPIGAVNIAVPTSRWTVDETLRQLLPQLLVTARAIERDVNAR
ncbi:IclR family transcriptional regulator [Cupriavidus gilardii]|uniref:IclR family transcriptional regulator n=1 Tax=Cupriavidus gilardii TaxID=82541 RepID=UPI001ABED66E|nr:IclR family transcriptional regulator [Cupriavidus gilardii]MBO4123058.1 IclR family transcriptional regulator [Cupriavidus gilardii]